VKNLESHIKGRTEPEGVWDQGDVNKNQDEGSTRRLQIAQLGSQMPKNSILSSYRQF